MIQNIQSKTVLIFVVIISALTLSLFSPITAGNRPRSIVANEPIRVVFFGSSMNNVAPLLYGQTFNLVTSRNRRPLKSNILASRFCESDSANSGRLRIVIGPYLNPSTKKPVLFSTCKQTTSELASSIVAVSQPPNWVAVFDVIIEWRPWKFIATLLSNSLVVDVPRRLRKPDADYFTSGIPKIVNKSISTESVEIGLDSSNRIRVAMAGLFQSNKLILTISSEMAEINLNDLSQPTMLSMIDSAPEYANYVGRIPIPTINAILTAQSEQRVSIKQGNSNDLNVSNIQLSGAKDVLIIRGNYRSSDLNAVIESRWIGEDLTLNEIIVLPELENCSSGDFQCIGRNTVRNSSSGAMATALTTNNKGNKLRPGVEEKHIVQINDLKLFMDISITRSSTDGAYFNLFGGAKFKK